MDATAPPLEAFSDTEGSAAPTKHNDVPQPPMPRLGSLGVHEPYVRSLVRYTNDWPKKGVTFMDMSSLLADSRALKNCIDSLVERYSGGYLTHVAGIDARGFTIGCARTFSFTFTSFRVTLNLQQPVVTNPSVDATLRPSAQSLTPLTVVSLWFAKPESCRQARTRQP